MPSDNVDALVAETRQLIGEVESGETEHAAWVAIQDRVQRLHAAKLTKAEVGRLLGKGDDWVRDVLRWNPAAAGLPFSTAARGRDHDRNLRGAARVLRDPDKRAEAFATLTPDERLAVAREAMAPEMRTQTREHKERDAHRESKPARERGYIELISSLLDGADLNILEAIHRAEDTTWDDDEVTAMALGRIDRTAMRLDLLRMAVKSEGDIAAELAKIEANG